MKKLKLALMLSLGLVAFSASNVFAATASTTFQVKITITNACDAASLAATNVDFGSHTFLDTNITANSSLSVKCTNGAPYTLSLDPGQNAATPGDTTTRRMLNGTTNYVPYNLFSNAGLTTSWGNTSTTGQVSGTGTGAVQSYPIYGKALPGNVPAGAYLDVVQATVTY